MSEKEEYAWTDTDKVVHLAIIEGNVLYQGDYIYSDDRFTVCGIGLPDGSELEPLSQVDIDCEDCLEQQYGPIVDQFVEKALRHPVHANVLSDVT